MNVDVGVRYIFGGIEDLVGVVNIYFVGSLVVDKNNFFVKVIFEYF